MAERLFHESSQYYESTPHPTSVSGGGGTIQFTLYPESNNIYDVDASAVYTMYTSTFFYLPKRVFDYGYKAIQLQQVL